MHASSGIIGAVVASLASLAAPVSARQFAGGVDMRTACVQQYGNGWTVSLGGNKATDWSCVDTAGTHYGLSVNGYCSLNYGRGAYADPQAGGAYDWACFWP